jgi:hypothetical protein
MATHTYLGNYPSSYSAKMNLSSNVGITNWVENLQGVTHDSENWFFTQKQRLWKIHARKDLNNDPILADDFAFMPSELSQLGCNHFGDLDYFKWNDKGYLFIPVEGENDCGKKPIVAVFRDEQGLPFVGYQPLEVDLDVENSRIGWCAINPINCLLYTSHNEITEKLPILRYQVEWDALENNEVIITPESTMTLWDSPAKQNHVNIPKYVQGGTFSPDGELYISSGKMLDFLDYFGAMYGGIFVFELFVEDSEAFGILQDRSSSTNMPFKYEYHPDITKNEEPEGLTYWDIDGLNFQVPGIEGQIHAILLDNNVWPLDDRIYFKHYRIE